ncbi:MFS transporter [Haloactinospora alba]|nr:MFS transporter [Haloactinospora alba]
MPEEPPLPRSLHVSYGMGALATSTFTMVPGLVLLYYLTDVLGVPAHTAGLVVFLPKVWDVLITPYAGVLCDRTSSALGPRRPWLLAGVLTLPVTFAAMFLAPPLSGNAAAGYVAVAFVLATTAYTAFQVPHIALPAEITGSRDQRSVLMSWRMLFAGVAILLAGGGAPALARHLGGDVDAYRVMAAALAGVLLVGTLATFLGTRSAPLPERLDPSGSLRAQVAVARRNPRFLRLLVTHALLTTHAGTMLAGSQYLATYIVGDAGAITPLYACLMAPLVATMPLWLRASRRLGKRAALLLTSAVFAAGTLALAATPLFGHPYTAPYSYLCLLVVGVGFAGAQMLPLSMLSDTMALDAAHAGKRRAGMFTGLWTAGETLAMAAGAGLFALVLSVGGFVPSTAASDAAQPDSALLAILLGMSLLPASLTAAGMLVLRRYDPAGDRPAPHRSEEGRQPSGAGTAPPTSG